METGTLSWLAQRVVPECIALIWKSFAVIAIAGLITAILRRASAALRHLVWLVALISLLCLPGLCCLLPAWHATIPMPSTFIRMPAANTAPLPSASQSLLKVQPSQPAAPAETIMDTGVVLSSPAYQTRGEIIQTAWRLWLMAAWLLGAGFVLLRMLFGTVAVRRSVCQCPPITSDPIAALTERARGDLGIRRTVALRLNTPGILPAVPLTFGWRRPIILLPEEAPGWTAERLRAVLLHEVAHIQRADWPLLLLAQGVCALYWFHPLVWLLAHRLRAESEIACDDLVLTTDIRPTDYAEHLLGIAQGLHGRLSHPAIVTMAHRSDIQTRLQTILAEGVRRQFPARRAQIALLAVAIALLFPLAAWQQGAEAQDNGQTSGADRASVREIARHWKTNLPGNVQVELKWVTGLLSNGKFGLWQPDGSDLKLEPQALRPSYTVKPGERNIAFKITVPNPQMIRHTYVNFHIEGTEITQITSASSVMRNGELQNYGSAALSEVFPASQKKATLIVQVAADPQKLILSGSPRQATTKRLDRGNFASLARAASGRAQSQGKSIAVYTVKLTLPSRLVKDCDYSFMYINRNGAPHYFQYTSANIPDTSGPQTTIRFTWRQSEVPLSTIREIRFLSRPFRTVVFPNIAIQPHP